MAKRLLCILSVIALALALASPTLAGPALDRIQKAGVLKVATNPSYPPMTVKATDGKIIGFDMDVAKMLASAMKVKLEIMPMPFENLLDAVAQGKADIAIGGISITAARNLKVVFVGPYLVAGQSVLTRVDKALALKGMADLNKPGMRVSAAKGTTGEMTVKDLLTLAKYIPAQDQQSALDLLISKKVDAVVADYPFCAVSSFRYRDKGVVASDRPFTFEPFGIALAPGDPQFANLLENFILVFKGSGQLDATQDYWFRNPKWMERLAK